MPHASSTHRNVHQSEQCLEGLYEHRADRCRQVDAHGQSVGLQLPPESFGTTGPCVGPVFPPVFLPLSGTGLLTLLNLRVTHAELRSPNHCNG